MKTRRGDDDLLKKKRLVIEFGECTYKGHMIRIRDVASVASLLV